MMVDVKFSQNDMGFSPAFDTGIQMQNSGNGVVFVPNVSEDGVLSWTNNGKLPNPAPVKVKGEDGIDGVDGKNGYIPVKGTDYWTEADRAQMVADVINTLPVYNGEVV